MKNRIFLYIAFVFFSFAPGSNFLSQQKKFPRVKEAIEEKQEIVLSVLKNSKLNIDRLNILIISYKDEQTLEIYGKDLTDSVYKKLTSFDVCESSGGLGPKRRIGDDQVPEGFYHVDRFNPNSHFHLSLGLNYPNESDKKKSKAAKLGGNIFIHGNCITIGCMPMTDDKIKEIYLYAINARNNGQLKIPVYVFPFRMTDSNFNSYKVKYKNDTTLINFWKNIKTGYDRFEKDKKELTFVVDDKGDYKFLD